MPRTISRPLLLVDAGNSRTKIGLFDVAGVRAGELPVCHDFTKIDNPHSPDWSRYSDALAHSHAAICLTGSNPPRVAELAAEFPAEWPRPLSLPSRSSFPVGIAVDVPERVGIDRLLNAIAANHLRKPHQAAVVVSSGTATTIDYLDSGGVFRGGAILPGFEMSARALHQYTSLLPLIPLSGVLETPPDEIGRNTEAAMESGLYWGHIGGVRELLRRFLNRAAAESSTVGQSERHLGNLGQDESPLVIVTGGAAPIVFPQLPSFCRHEPALALQGLAILMIPRLS
jgi:type III pantothenate kinase